MTRKISLHNPFTRARISRKLRTTVKKAKIGVPLGVFLFMGSMGTHVLMSEGATYTWDGGGTTNNWSDCANWSTNVCPTAADSVVFNSTSTKDSTIDASWGGTIVNININAGYSGTITTDISVTLTGTFTQSSGTFIAPSTTLEVRSQIALSGGNFLHNNGTISMTGSSSGSRTISCSGAPFNLITINKTGSGESVTVNSGCSVPLGEDPVVQVGTNGLRVNGTITGTGTLSIIYYNGSTTIADLTLACGSNSCLSGFTGISIADELILTSSGTDFNANDYSLLTVRGLNIGSGTQFTAPSGTLDLSTDLNLQSGSTFNHSGGTINMMGGGVGARAISCSGAPFNLITINKTGSGESVTVNSGCSVPLGEDPVVQVGTNGLRVNGTITGTGTLTVLSHTGSTYTTDLILACGSNSCISGFTEITSVQDFIVSGAGTEFETGNITLVLYNLEILSGATFIAPANTMNLSGSINISSGSSFNHNGGTVNMTGGGSGVRTITCTGSPFNLITINKNTSGEGVRINSGCTVNLGHNPIVQVGGNNFTINGTVTGSGTLTLRYYNGSSSFASLILSCGSNTCLSGITGLDIANSLTLSTAGTELDATNYNSIAVSSLSIAADTTLTAPSGGIFSIKGNFNPLGTFNHNNGTVVLNGVNQTITGSHSFYNLTISSSTNRQVTFQAGSTTTVLNRLEIASTGQDMLLRSSSSGTQWNIIANGPTFINNVNVQDSDACGGRNLIAESSTNSGNNECWTIHTSTTGGKNFILRGVKITGGTTIYSE